MMGRGVKLGGRTEIKQGELKNVERSTREVKVVRKKDWDLGNGGRVGNESVGEKEIAELGKFE